MPLRALLLASEQPSFTPSSSTLATASKVNTNAKGKHIPSPLNLTPSSKLSAVLGALSPALVTASGSQSAKLDKAVNSNGNGDELTIPELEDMEDVLTGRTDLGWPFDIPDKPLPSPPIPPKDFPQEPEPSTSNRSSNQTYQTSLTLPSTSGSSRSGSTECPSPPLSPSPTTLITSPLALSSSLPVSPLALVKKQTKAPTVIINPSIKRDARGRPLLKLATTFPRVGSGLKYRAPPAPSTSRPFSQGLLEGEVVVDSPYADSSDDENDDGRRTAREAVDERLRHLVETRNTLLLPDLDSRPSSPSGEKKRGSQVMFTSPISSRPASKLLEGLNKISRLSTLSIPAKVSPAPPLALPSKTRKSTRRRQPTRKGTHLPLLAVNPPPAPTAGLPPYKILSARELLDLLGDSYLDSFGDGRSVNFKGAWKKRDLSKIRRTELPKGTKGRYIRLCTLSPLPEPLPPPQPKVDEDELDVSASTRKGKGRQPTVFIENSIEKEETKEEKEIPTVYLPNTLREHQEPIACFACPPLSLHTMPNTPSTQRKGPGLSLQLPSTTIHELPDRTHLLPLPHLTSHQRMTLQALGLLVYAVPRSYEGPIPPQILLDEEVVGPWATSSRMGVGLLSGGKGDNRSSTLSVASSVGSPLRSAFPPTSPLRLGFNRDNTTAIATIKNSLGVDVASSGSRWGWKRSSNLSVRSTGSAISEEGEQDEAVLNVGISRPTSPDHDAASTHSSSAGGAGGWGTSFTSLRARAQDYYASRSASPLVGSPSPSTRSLAEPETTSIVDTPAVESVMPLALGKKSPLPPQEETTNTPPIGTSRSFGSFFSRNNSSPATPSGSVSASGVTSSFSMSALMGRSSSNSSAPASSGVPTPSEEDEALKELREAGIVVKCLDDQGAEEEVVFDFNTLKSNASSAAAEETSGVSSGEEKKAGWGWRGRWGS